MDATRIVFCHLPTLEIAEARNREKAAEFVGKWTLDKMPRTVNDLTKMIELARFQGFRHGVRVALDRMAELSKESPPPPPVDVPPDEFSTPV